MTRRLWIALAGMLAGCGKREALLTSGGASQAVVTTTGTLVTAESFGRCDERAIRVAVYKKLKESLPFTYSFGNNLVDSPGVVESYEHYEASTSRRTDPSVFHGGFCAL